MPQPGAWGRVLRLDEHVTRPSKPKRQALKPTLVYSKRHVNPVRGVLLCGGLSHQREQLGKAQKLRLKGCRINGAKTCAGSVFAAYGGGM